MKRVFLLVIGCSLLIVDPLKGRGQSLHSFLYTSLGRAAKEFNLYKEAYGKGEYEEAEKSAEECLLNVQRTLVRQLIWEAIFYKRVTLNPAQALRRWWDLLYQYPEAEEVSQLGRDSEAKLAALLGFPEAMSRSTIQDTTYPVLRIRKDAYPKLKEALHILIEVAIKEAEEKIREITSSDNPLHWVVLIEKHRQVVRLLRCASAGLLLCLGDLYVRDEEKLSLAKAAYKRCIELYPETEAAILARFKIREEEVKGGYARHF